MALLAALSASIAVSVFFTHRVTGSLSAVTTAALALAEGDHTVRVPRVNMGRQFDDLADAFNTMASDLAEVETTRTKMLGNLAHEMRTPLAIIDGYLQAIGDGVRQADEDTLVMLQDQVVRLSRLGEDIVLVTTAEEGRLTMRRVPVPATTVLTAAHAHDGTVTVTASSAGPGAGATFTVRLPAS